MEPASGMSLHSKGAPSWEKAGCVAPFLPTEKQDYNMEKSRQSTSKPSCCRPRAAANVPVW